MDKFENKLVCFATSLQNAYKEEEEKDYFPALELVEEELTEDFTAMLYAMWYLYQRITGDEIDIIGFTHILNRLAIQNVMKKEEE